jgi:hypothetical protein
MPPWMSSDRWRAGVPRCSGDEFVELACDVAFEAADRFASGLAFADASVDVGAGAQVPAKSRYESFRAFSVAAGFGECRLVKRRTLTR